MAAPTVPVAGWEMTLKHDTAIIGCSIDSTLVQTAEPIPALCKSNQAWENTFTGRTSWIINYQSFFEDAASPVIQQGSTGVFTVGGTALKGWDQITLNLEADVITAINKTTGLAGTVIPTTRRLRCSVSGDFYDPLDAGASALQTIQDYVDGTSSAGIAFVLTYGNGGSISWTGRPLSLEINAPVGDAMQNSIEIAATGTVTDGSANEDPGISTILADFFGATGVTSGTALMSNQATYSQWTGTVYPTQLTISIPFEGNIEISGQLLGSGSITHAATV